VEDGEGGAGWFWGDEGGYRGSGSEALVEEWDADEGAAEGGEEAEGGNCGGGVAG
jgi:hypothetical protein